MQDRVVAGKSFGTVRRGGRAKRLRSLAQASAAALAVVGMGRSVRAATTLQVWDPSGSGASGGTGTWSASPSYTNWDIAGVTGQAWQNGNDAEFNGSAGTVTVDATGISLEAATFNTSGYVLAGGPITLVNTNTNPQFHVGAGTTTINSVLQGTLGVTLLGAGSGSTTIVLGGANTYTGTTLIEQATVNISTLSTNGGPFGNGGNITLGGLSSAASITNTGAGGSTAALLNLTGATTGLSIVNNGTGPIAFTNTGVANIGTAAAETVTLKGSYAGVNTFAESLVDLGTSTNVTKLVVGNTSAATWLLSGSSAYSGGTTLSFGTLQVGQSASLGTGPLVASGSASTTLAATTGLTLANPITLTSGFTTTLRNVGPVAGGTFVVAGLISGSGSVTLGGTSNSTAGPLQLSNDGNTFTANLTTSYGFIKFTSVANAGIASSLGAGSTYTLGNSTSYETFQYVGANSTSTTRAINWTGTTGNLALDASGTGTVGYLSTAALRSGVGANTLALQGTNAGLNTLAQVINDSTGGATGVTKAGTGKWVLTGQNTYTGPTTITAGTLVANNAVNSLGVGSTTTVSGTGVLAGGGNTGTGAVVINSGGTITTGSGATAGDTAGTLATAAQTWNSSGGYVVKLATNGTTTTADNLVMTGLTVAAASGTPFLITAYGSAVNLSGGAQVLIATDSNTSSPSATTNPFAAAIANSLILVNNPSSTVNVPAGETLSLVAGSDASGGFELYLTDVSATPEPTSLALALAAATPLVLGRRRRAAR